MFSIWSEPLERKNICFVASKVKPDRCCGSELNPEESVLKCSSAWSSAPLLLLAQQPPASSTVSWLSVCVCVCLRVGPGQREGHRQLAASAPVRQWTLGYFYPVNSLIKMEDWRFRTGFAHKGAVWSHVKLLPRKLHTMIEAIQELTLVSVPVCP